MLSLTGLLAPAHPGELHRFKRERATSTTIGLTPNSTHFVQATVPVSSVNPQRDLVRLRNAMHKLRETAAAAIAYGVRASTLVVGPDITTVETGQQPQWHWWESKFPWLIARVQDEDVRLTSHVLQAQHLMWFQDVTLSRRVAAHLQASANQLSEIAQTLKELDRIEIDLVLSSLENFGNMGSMANVKRQKSPALIQGGKYSPLDPAGSDEWHTIYYVDTHLDDLKGLYRQ